MKPTDQYRRADLAPPARRHGCRPHEPGPVQTRRRSSAGAHCSPPRPERHALARPLLRLLLAAMAVLVLAGGIFAWRYRGELRRFFRTIKGA